MIKSFLYLDSDKLRSISSQLFEGVTERVLKFSSEQKTDTESQKGPVGSGRVLADIFAKEKSTTELRFLEDYALTILEDELISREMVIQINENSISLDDDVTFIEVTSRLRVNDLEAIHKMLSDFNNVGEAFWRVIHTPAKPSGANTKALGDTEVRKIA